MWKLISLCSVAEWHLQVWPCTFSLKNGKLCSLPAQVSLTLLTFLTREPVSLQCGPQSPEPWSSVIPQVHISSCSKCQSKPSREDGRAVPQHLTRYMGPDTHHPSICLPMYPSPIHVPSHIAVLPPTYINHPQTFPLNRPFLWTQHICTPPSLSATCFFFKGPSVWVCDGAM